MTDALLFAVVVARVLVPLWIPRFPIPALLGALVLDAADQTIFEALDAVPGNYQSYDKALDVYYLAIAYLSTIRNWTGGASFRIAQFLWYYRLIGVVAFEASGARFLLLIFPNTFEYFFIFVEAIRLRYEPGRLAARQAAWAAAIIWIVVKLPQEWWIHVAQLDVTELLGDNQWLTPLLAVLVIGAGRAVTRRREHFPGPDWPTTFDVDAHRTTVLGAPADPPHGPRALINHPLTEKVLLISLITVTFSQILPDTGVSALQLAEGVAFVVIVNSFITDRLFQRGSDWTKVTVHLLTMAVVNAAVLAAYVIVVRGNRAPPIANAAVYLGLLTLIGTLYDRYRYLRLRSLAIPASPIRELASWISRLPARTSRAAR